MSINHLISPIQNPKLDLYVRNVDAKSATIEEDLQVNNDLYVDGDAIVQGRVNANQYKLIGLQEVSVGVNDINKGLFPSKLNLSSGSSVWVSLIDINEAKLTREKLHYNPETNKFRKVFTFSLDFSLNVDYTLRGTENSISLNFVCNGFEDFVPETPLGARINKLVSHMGNWQTSSNSGAIGQIRCFDANNAGQEGFTIVLLNPTTWIGSGTDQYQCQVSASIMDSEEIE